MAFPDRFPILRALLAQALAFVLALGLQALGFRGPGWAWVLIQGGMAAALGRFWGLRGWWTGFQLLLPLALAWQAGTRIPGWVYPALLLTWGSIYGGGLLTRVPLYLSSRPAWEALEGLLPPEPGTFVDLGAGLGDPLAWLARRHPDWRFRGVEASPLSAFIAKLRVLGRPNCRVRLGSLWREDLADCQVLHAFLSPAPMAELWAKACREMPEGSRFISHSFAVPGLEAEARLPLPGRPGACLWVYRVPGFKAPDPPAET